MTRKEAMEENTTLIATGVGLTLFNLILMVVIYGWASMLLAGLAIFGVAMVLIALEVRPNGQE